MQPPQVKLKNFDNTRMKKPLGTIMVSAQYENTPPEVIFLQVVGDGCFSVLGLPELSALNLGIHSVKRTVFSLSDNAKMDTICHVPSTPPTDSIQPPEELKTSLPLEGETCTPPSLEERKRMRIRRRWKKKDPDPTNYPFPPSFRWRAHIVQCGNEDDATRNARKHVRFRSLHPRKSERTGSGRRAIFDSRGRNTISESTSPKTILSTKRWSSSS